jgi:hypothetical protein
MIWCFLLLSPSILCYILSFCNFFYFGMAFMVMLLSGITITGMAMRDMYLLLKIERMG